MYKYRFSNNLNTRLGQRLSQVLPLCYCILLLGLKKKLTGQKFSEK